ncbi:hypothetical protein ACQJBY_049327 [Aegilops geniculata]
MARMAPDAEKKLAKIAIAIVGESSILLLEVDDVPPSRPSSMAKRVDLVSCLRCLQACFSTAPTTPRVKPRKLSQKATPAPTAVPVLPLHRHQVKRQAKIVDQRTFIFGLTLSTTIALFTTMKVESVMSAEVAAWVGGGSAIAWLCVNGGSMMNLYGQSIFEQRAAQHLSRLGMMGLALLFCLSMYACFPHLLGLFWTLVGLATALHAALWLLSCFRHDDDSTVRLSDEDLCMCPRCKPSCTCCSNRGFRAPAVESL